MSYANDMNAPLPAPAPAPPEVPAAAAPTSTAPAPESKRPRARLNTSDLRMACMRLSRRVRFESEGDVRPGQFGVLANLATNGAKTPGELANDDHVQAPSMTRTITMLADRGWVRRDDHPTDRRQILVSITDEGRTALKASKRQRDEWVNRRAATLSDDERRILAEATPILMRLANS
jgi:DNA-binding MarR family transcriptional regulator